jgi:ribose 5-phosphate isomerase B
MKIAAAGDHAGYLYKDRIAQLLRSQGHDVHDFGTNSPVAVDYPDYGYVVGEAVASGRFERGILVCGSSDANVLALSERLTGWEMIERLLQVFFETPFDGGRHAHRIAKLDYVPEVRAKALADLARGTVVGAETPSVLL